VAVVAGAQLVAAPAAATVCHGAHALGDGEPAPCSGIIVPEVDAIRALRCIREALPTCVADAGLREAELLAENRRLETVLEVEVERVASLAMSLDSIPPVVHPGSSWTRTAIWSGAALLVGLAAGAALSGASLIGY